MFDLFDYNNRPDTLNIKVTPRAKKVQIKKETTSDGKVLYRVYVNVPAEDGKANDAVIELIAKELDIAKSKITIMHGKFCRDKVLKIDYD